MSQEAVSLASTPADASLNRDGGSRPRRRIAIIGSGVSGLYAAHLLHREHDITVLEHDARIGGHSHTYRFKRWGRTYEVDTGFIVYNERNYPLFTALLEELGIKTQPTAMTFSVHDGEGSFEYGGASLNALFAQRRHFASPRFLGMIRDILRFGKNAPADAERAPDSLTLGEYLDASDYSGWFVDRYLIPMGGAIWSASGDSIRNFPFRAFVRFFENHGMLLPGQRPQWRTIAGGSQQYVERLIDPWRDRIRTNAGVQSITREADRVTVHLSSGGRAYFDDVVLAVHSDQALRLLADPSPEERRVLSAIPYQDNDVVLHTDRAMLPRRRRAWSAWNYHLSRNDADTPSSKPVGVTYCMNILQGLESPNPICATLNRSDKIDPESIIARFSYAHPSYSPEGFAAQSTIPTLNGERRTYYCGAWCGYGFHEDGIRSAASAVDALLATTHTGPSR